jgi:hypothetical protein
VSAEPIHHSGHAKVPHPRAVFVVGDKPAVRDGYGYGDRVYCFCWTGRELRPSDGVYDLPVCGRCARGRRG